MIDAVISLQFIERNAKAFQYKVIMLKDFLLTFVILKYFLGYRGVYSLPSCDVMMMMMLQSLNIFHYLRKPAIIAQNCGALYAINCT